MDFYGRMRTLETRILTLHHQWEQLYRAYGDAHDFTMTFLEACQKNGISIVSIQTKTDLIPETKTFPFGVRGSVFSDDVSVGGWPAIWLAVRDAGLQDGCGNGNQMQTNCSKLVDGVYELKDGKWRRIDGDDQTYGESE